MRRFMLVAILLGGLAAGATAEELESKAVEAPAAGTTAATAAAEALPAADSWAGKIVVVPVKGVILPYFSSLPEDIKKTFARIGQEKPRLVVVELDCQGGEVDACDQIRKTVLDCPVPTAALVLRDAISGGAMIASACKRINMVAGSRLGDIQPMDAAGRPIDERSGEKIESYVRSIMAATAEHNGYSKRLVEAMVSRDLELYEVRFTGEAGREFLTGKEVEVLEENIAAGREKRTIAAKRLICESGKLLTLTAQEAKEYGLAAAVFQAPADYYSSLGGTKDLVTAPIAEGKVDVDKLLADFSTPKMMLLAVFLILGIAGALTEFYTPGFGIPGAVSLIGFAGFFSILFLDGRASPVEIGLFIVGIMLLVVEVVVLPGFGLPGFLGAIFVLLGIGLAFLPPFDSAIWLKNPWGEMGMLVLLLSGVFLVVCLFLYLLIEHGEKLPLIRHLFHETSFSGGRSVMETVRAEEAADASREAAEHDPHVALRGLKGTAQTMLRPAGKVTLDDGRLVDVVTEGGLINAGARVVVADTSMNRIVVRPADQA